MPSELRVISFGLHEIAGALRDCGPTLGIQFPDTRLVSIRDDDHWASKTLHLTFKGQAGVISVEDEALMEALIQLCISKGIPLPRQGTKSMSAQQHCAELRISISDPTSHQDDAEVDEESAMASAAGK